MHAVAAHTLKVPGATLYYETRGTGPVLLLICGGLYDAGAYGPLAERLADRYTVVTYDRRGNSRSPLDGPPEPQRIPVHADDAHRLLSAVGVTAGEPARVFGNSSGAIIGLELAARHPEQVSTLVAHEPPLFELLPDRERWRTVIKDVEDTFAKEGAGPAGEVLNAAFAAASGAQGAQKDGHPTAAEGHAASDGSDGEAAADQPRRIPGGAEEPRAPDPAMMEMMARIGKNMEFFIGYEVPRFATFTPDLAALRASSTRVVAAVGQASEGEPPYRAAVAVAERMGTRPSVFPGDHGGFGAEADGFAAKLREVLASS